MRCSLQTALEPPFLFQNCMQCRVLSFLLDPLFQSCLFSSPKEDESPVPCNPSSEPVTPWMSSVPTEWQGNREGRRRGERRGRRGTSGCIEGSPQERAPPDAVQHFRQIKNDNKTKNSHDSLLDVMGTSFVPWNCSWLPGATAGTTAGTTSGTWVLPPMVDAVNPPGRVGGA